MSRAAEQPHDTGLRPEAIDPERPEPCETPWGSFALYRVEDEILALESFCPHLQGPLFQGSVGGGAVVCPWHSWRFDLASGACTWRPEGRESEVRPLRRLVASIGPRGTVLLCPASDG